MIQLAKITIVFLLLLSSTSLLFAQERIYQKDKLHDKQRPVPARVLTAGALTTPPPSDAIVLFDGHTTDAWEGGFLLVDTTHMVAAPGGMRSKQHFGDIQLHIEWRMNDSLTINGQKGGNSGIFLMGKYEVQVLENFVNQSYADGQAGAMYGQYPPLVNASAPQGNWNSYDIFFTAPVYENGTLVKKAKLTLLYNGVVVQLHQEYEGPTLFRKVTSYPAKHPEKGPIFLQYHNDPVEYRNIWVREIEEKTVPADAHLAWINPFPKGEEGKKYHITSKSPTTQQHFTVTDNSIEVLYDWVGEEAPFAMISTDQAYSHYNLELEYKWGDRKFAPRLERKRDAGILFHVYKDLEVWPSGLECQVQETDTGDLWVIKGPKVEVLKKDRSLLLLDTALKPFQHSQRYALHEVEGWNHVRVEVRGSESARYFVNGQLVNEIRNFRDDSGNLLEKGKIALQAEGAELTYRNIRLQVLDK